MAFQVPAKVRATFDGVTVFLGLLVTAVDWNAVIPAIDNQKVAGGIITAVGAIRYVLHFLGKDKPAA